MSNDSSRSLVERDHREETPQHNRFFHPILAIVIVMAIYALGQFSSIVLTMIYPLLYGKEGAVLSEFFRHSTEAQFVHVLLIELLLLVLILAALKLKRIDWKSIGIRAPKLRDVAYGVLGFGYYFPIVLLTSFLFTKFIPTFDVEQQQSIGFQFATGGELVYVFIALVILPPLIEELLFRGFLYTQLAKAWSAVPAAIITSALFAAAHLSGSEAGGLLWVAALDTFILSLALVYVRYKTDSLWPAIILHALKNGIAFMYLFLLPLR